MEPLRLDPEQATLVERINELKVERDALIVVHNYHPWPNYFIADFIGDSYGLAKEAAKATQKHIIFCGVRFMAESAAAISLGKHVWLPHPEAGCPMADMVDQSDLEWYRSRWPDAALVAYINTNASIKAQVDVVCTSANAAKVVAALPRDEVIFLPDLNLADHVARQLGARLIIPLRDERKAAVKMITDELDRKVLRDGAFELNYGKRKTIIGYDGMCHVHMHMRATLLESVKAARPNAKIIAHPECLPKFREAANYICSTSKMIDVVREDPSKEFVIGTEKEMVWRIHKAFDDAGLPRKALYWPGIGWSCTNMKKNSLARVLALLDNRELLEAATEEGTDDIRLIKLESYIAEGARASLERMLEIGA